MPSFLLNQLQYAAASYQVVDLCGKDGSGVSFILAFAWLGRKRRICSSVTSVAAMANVRRIRLLCWISASCLSFSVAGDPIRNSAGPGITTIVWPWLLTYHCGGEFSFSLVLLR